MKDAADAHTTLLHLLWILPSIYGVLAGTPPIQDSHVLQITFSRSPMTPNIEVILKFEHWCAQRQILSTEYWVSLNAWSQLGLRSLLTKFENLQVGISLKLYAPQGLVMWWYPKFIWMVINACTGSRSVSHVRKAGYLWESYTDLHIFVNEIFLNMLVSGACEPEWTEQQQHSVYQEKDRVFGA